MVMARACSTLRLTREPVRSGCKRRLGFVATLLFALAPLVFIQAGCSGRPLVNGLPCVDDSTCPADSLCFENICTPACTTNLACDGDMICGSDHVCIARTKPTPPPAPPAPPPPAPPAPPPPPAEPVACANDHACPAPQLCSLARLCVEPCASQDDCQGERAVCHQGRCEQAQCRVGHDEDCHQGLRCVRGMCVPPPPECVMAEDCGDVRLFICSEAGTCLQRPCVNDGSCDPGYLCEPGPGVGVGAGAGAGAGASSSTLVCVLNTCDQNPTGGSALAGDEDRDGVCGNGTDVDQCFNFPDHERTTADVEALLHGVPLDSNCDGVEGRADLAFFVAPPERGGREGDGDAMRGMTPQQPLARIQEALDRAAAQVRSGVLAARNRVYVAAGIYDEALVLPPGVSLFGGYSVLDGYRQRHPEHVVVVRAPAGDLDAGVLPRPALTVEIYGSSQNETGRVDGVRFEAAPGVAAVAAPGADGAVAAPTALGPWSDVAGLAAASSVAAVFDDVTERPDDGGSGTTTAIATLTVADCTFVAGHGAAGAAAVPPEQASVAVSMHGASPLMAPTPQQCAEGTLPILGGVSGQPAAVVQNETCGMAGGDGGDALCGGGFDAAPMCLLPNQDVRCSDGDAPVCFANAWLALCADGALAQCHDDTAGSGSGGGSSGVNPGLARCVSWSGMGRPGQSASVVRSSGGPALGGVRSDRVDLNLVAGHPGAPGNPGVAGAAAVDTDENGPVQRDGLFTANPPAWLPLVGNKGSRGGPGDGGGGGGASSSGVADLGGTPFAGNAGGGGGAGGCGGAGGPGGIGGGGSFGLWVRRSAGLLLQRNRIIRGQGGDGGDGAPGAPGQPGGAGADGTAVAVLGEDWGTGTARAGGRGGNGGGGGPGGCGEGGAGGPSVGVVLVNTPVEVLEGSNTVSVEAPLDGAGLPGRSGCAVAQGSGGATNSVDPAAGGEGRAQDVWVVSTP